MEGNDPHAFPLCEAGQAGILRAVLRRGRGAGVKGRPRSVAIAQQEFEGTTTVFIHGCVRGSIMQWMYRERAGTGWDRGLLHPCAGFGTIYVFERTKEEYQRRGRYYC